MFSLGVIHFLSVSLHVITQTFFNVYLISLVLVYINIIVPVYIPVYINIISTGVY